jgi:MOSC domain-containing protein YiiM
VPHVVSITYTPAGVERKPDDRYARVSLDRATLVERHGIEGDLKASRGERQLNVMQAEIIEQLRAEGFHTGPGELGEQIVIAGLAPADLADGSRLRLGETAVIEVAKPRTGCDRFEHIQGQTRQAVQGRIGVMARVVRGGEVAVGDVVCVETGPDGLTTRDAAERKGREAPGRR